MENDQNPSAMDHPQNRTPIWIIALVLGTAAIILFILGWAVSKKDSDQSIVGKPAPQFSFISNDGNAWNNEILSGKVVVLNFWASWCHPCQQEAEILQQAWEDLQPEGKVVLIGISYEDEPADALAYLVEYGITYPNVVENEEELEKVFRVTGVPSTFLINKEGIVIDFKLGPFLDETEILEWVEKAF